MDPTSFALLFTRPDLNSYCLILILVAMFCGETIMAVLSRFNKQLQTFIDTDRSARLTIVGVEEIVSGRHTYEYPKPFIAVSYYAYSRNKCKILKYLSVKKNEIGSRWWQIPTDVEKNEKTSNYVNDDTGLLSLTETITMEVTKKCTQTTMEKIITLRAKKGHDLNYLRSFVKLCMDEYDEFMHQMHSNKIYHFIYKGSASVTQEGRTVTQLEFNTNLISDLNTAGRNTSYEDFCHIFNEHTERIQKDMDRLHDIRYYQKFGLKRKKGYLFYGFPGCGKTYTVMAMANYDKRHIIEVPMSRLKTNRELEDILNLTEIHGISFRREQLIILFDEIDTGGKAVQKREEEQPKLTTNQKESKADETKSKPEESKPTEKKAEETPSKPQKKEDEGEPENNGLLSLLTGTLVVKNPDQLNLGSLLSRMDGIGNYDGLIVVATTNCKEKLSPALYRHGRLDPIFFDFARREDIQKMIQVFYDRKMTDGEILRLPDRQHKIAPSSIRKYIEDHEQSYEKLVEFLETLRSP